MLQDLIKNFINQMGFFTSGEFELVPFLLRLVMILVACVLIYLAIAKGFEPYLLIPIGIGMLLVNLAPGLYNVEHQEGLFYQFHHDPFAMSSIAKLHLY